MPDATTTPFAHNFAMIMGVAPMASIDTPEVLTAELEQVHELDADTAGEQLFANPSSNPGDLYARLWRDYLKAYEAWQHRRQALHDLEGRLIEAPHLRAIPEQSNSKDEAPRMVANKILGILAGLADKHFAPQGGQLKVDRVDITERFYLSDRRDDAVLNFDPGQVWSHLKATYDGEAGNAVAWQQIANEFRKKFGIARKAKLKTVGNYVVLDVSVALDSLHKKYGRDRLCHSSCEAVAHACRAAAGVAGWAKQYSLAADLQKFAQETYCSTEQTVESRKQHKMGEQAQVVLVTMHSKYEFRFRKDFAEQIQVFLGTYSEAEE